MRTIGLSLLLTLLLGAGPARAELVRGSYDYPSPIALDGQIGTQLGLGGTTPGGFLLQLGYHHRFASTRDRNLGIWFFGNVDLEFGPGTGLYRGIDNPNVVDCGPVGCGQFAGAAAGVELTFRTVLPLVPFAKAGLGLGGVYGRTDCQNNGVAITLVNAALGLRYFLTKHIGVGIEAGLALGPAIYGSGNAEYPGCSQLQFWRATSLLAGVQYAL